MKIRTGFVSNSSSSSFVAFVKKSKRDELVKSQTDEELKAFLKATGQTTKLGEEKFVALHIESCEDWSTAQGYLEGMNKDSDKDIGWEEAEKLNELVEDFCYVLSDSKDALTHETRS